MKKLLVVLFFPFLLYGQNEKTDFNLTIYPSSGGGFGYFIEIEETILKVSLKEISFKDNKVTLGELNKVEQLKLSKSQISKIKSYVEEIKGLNIKIIDTDLSYDTWVFDFFINKKQSLKVDFALLKSSLKLKKTDKFIKYITKISPLKMKLNSFS